MNVIKRLEQRGYIENITHQGELEKLLKKEKIHFYIGIDPTADSLHIGHFVTLMVVSHLQKAGHTPIILLGGGTAAIGDPSDRTDMRKMLTREELDSNVENIRKQVERLVSFDGENGAKILNNADWLLDLQYIDFMRNIGVHFNVNNMLRADCYKTRLEEGLTFFELGYMLMQAYDYLHLNDKYNCKMQLGGSDQWSNIIAGVDLIRKKKVEEVYGLTLTLLTNKEGKKMGKTVSGAVWLDPNKMSAYEFYQYWRNVDDSEIEKILNILTFLEEDEINEVLKIAKKDINKAKTIMAREVTAVIHGEKEAEKAVQTAEAAFSGEGDFSSLPETEIEQGTRILEAVVLAELAKSNGEVKKLIKGNAITVNDKQITDINYVLDEKDLNDEQFILLKKGKKHFVKIVFK